MADIWMDVDVALTEVPVNLMPLVSDADFKTIEAAVAYNAAGMALFWHFINTAGVYNNGVAVTPTNTGGAHDWVDHGTHGIYTIEIPASGGTVNNDTEGFGWFTGQATGIAPWRGPVIGFRAAALNDAMIDGTLAAFLNKIADHVKRRTQANTEASSDGDTITNAKSLFGMIQQVQQSDTTTNTGFLTVFLVDGSTELEQKPIGTDPADEPINSIG